MPNKNISLLQARTKKNNEFFTRYEDVEKELSHYHEFLKDKSVICCCNDSEDGAFYSYFKNNFDAIGLKEISALTYSTDWNTHGKYIIKTKHGEIRKELNGSGDFRSDEVIELIRKSDVVVTNPPFSYFCHIIKLVVSMGKDFVILGPQSGINTRSVFPLLKDGVVKLGYGFNRNVGYFVSDYEDYASSTGHKKGLIRVPGVTWFTTFPIKNSQNKLSLQCSYSPELYPKYENLDAIEVGKISEIPVDYDGLMGVPITYMYRHDPELFEIVGISYAMAEPITIDGKYMQNPSCVYLKNSDGSVKGVYARIIIKSKKKIKKAA